LPPVAGDIPPSEAGTPRVLRFVPAIIPSSLDSLWAQSVATREAAFISFDTLYGLDASLTPQPQMAVGHELSGDRLTWRFTLREGLRFHDGEPVRARDGVASIGRWAQRAPLGVSMKKQLDEIRAIDDRSPTEETASPPTLRPRPRR
jgi:peptide/nickel transport system substrate-binding protein